MIQKDEFLDFLEKSLRGNPVDISVVIELISDYLTEIKYENADKIIYLLLQKPELIQIALPKVIDYFRRKWTIFSLTFNNKIILYYDSY